MGNNGNKQERVVPERGYRVISISKKYNGSQLNLLTDYILSPDPKLIDLRRDTIRFEVYSILSEDIRTVELQVVDKELGLQVRLDQINTCILRITKIFPGSPLEKFNIRTGEFIVGVLEGNFTCIKTFAQFISSITALAPKSNVSLGICGEDGKTRIVVIPVAQLKAWQAKRKGLLGCELAEGWIHKWKPSKQRKPQDEQEVKQQQKASQPQPQIQIPRIKPIEQEHEVHSGSSDEVDRKCDALEGCFNSEGVMEVKYKGILRNEEIADASTICRCKPLNRTCEKCFIQKDENFYFFSTKINQIVSIPSKMMLPVNE